MIRILNLSNKLIKRIFTLFLLNLLVLNNVWATVHLAKNDHQNHAIPHLHANLPAQHVHSQHTHHSHFDNIDQSSWIERDNPSEHAPSIQTEHDNETHFHVHLHAYLVNSTLPSIIASGHLLPFSLEKTFQSLTYTPPIPPPTV